jgi:hypothetical protein
MGMLPIGGARNIRGFVSNQQVREGPATSPADPSLGQMREKGREKFSPQESRQDCVPQKSLCLWHNLTRKVSPER